MKKLQWNSVVRVNEGLMVSFRRSKQRSNASPLSAYLIPYNVENPNLCCVAFYDDYVRRVTAKGIVRSPESSFWVQVQCKSNGSKQFKNQNMGRLLSKAGTYSAVRILIFHLLGNEIARYLQLREPEKYTSHCFRRTSATMMADGGATSEELKRYNMIAVHSFLFLVFLVSLAGNRKRPRKSIWCVRKPL